jgi:hypothetical protein
MEVFLFRRKAESVAALGFCEVGLVVVAQVADLFWALDEFGNPYDFEVCPARPGDALHAWQRDYSKIVAAETKTKTAPGTCFFTDDCPHAERSSMATISETLMDQTERKWSPFIRDELV